MHKVATNAATSGPLLRLSILLTLAAASGCPPARDTPADQRADRGSVTPSDASRATAKPAFVPCATMNEPSGALTPTIRIQGAALTARGSRLVAERLGRDGDTRRASPLRLGVLADTREALPATVEALVALRSAFIDAKVDAIIVLGGIEATFDGMRLLLTRLGTGVPLLAMPGDLASHEGFQAALRELGSRAVDLTSYRLVELPGATLAAVPGYYRRHHIAAGPQGCSYSPGDLQQLGKALAARGAIPRVVLSYGPPRGDGAHAVDRAYGDVNIGDRSLARLMRETGARFGLFSHVCESGGHATDLDGHPVAEDSWSDSLLVNVGAADSVPCQRLDGSWWASSAVIFEVSARGARFRRVHSRKPRTRPKAVKH